MTKDELLTAFLGGFPESSHPLDMKRFVKYAIACIDESSYLDIEAMREKISVEKISEYESAYSWIREAYEIIQGSN